MEETQHKRRKRYKGTHPVRFEDKYKEHQPERYAADVEHIISKGKTPAGTHIPIMAEEILAFLAIRPGMTGYDATLGYGGHSSRMLACLEGQGHLYATDADPIESKKTIKRLADMGYGPEILTVKNINFTDCDQVAPDHPFDFVLADLGVSSMQIDDPSRGFSYKHEGPLDLRLNPEAGVSASERLKQLSEEEIAGMLYENSDEPYAERIAAAIVNHIRRGMAPETTTQLAQIIEKALVFLPEKERKDAVKKSCARCFQAIRIDVNSEFEVLYSFLDKLPSITAPGARIAILTFHSGEDRLVKQALKDGLRAGVYSEVSDLMRPSPEECNRNPRAHSSKLRCAVRSK